MSDAPVELAVVELASVKTMADFVKLPIKQAISVAYQLYKQDQDYPKFDMRMRNWWRYNHTKEPLMTKPTLDKFEEGQAWQHVQEVFSDETS